MESTRGRRIADSMRLEILKQLNESQMNNARIENSCQILGISSRTSQRWRQGKTSDRRKGPLTVPANKLSTAEQAVVLEIANSREFRDKSPAQIVPLLADKGVYKASESTFYRLLNAHNLNKHRGRAKPPTRQKPIELTAAAPNEIYSWDITYLPSDVKGVFHYLYLFMDVFSRKIVGQTVASTQCSTKAAKLVQEIYEHENLEPGQVSLHSDNGGPMKGATMLATLQRLGVIPSFSRPSVSDDNPFSESLFKTVKYCPQYPSRPFRTIEEAQSWATKFTSWYNEEHLHSGIRFVTPGSRHRGDDLKILASRRVVYETARQNNPERWSKETRNWNRIEKVSLNPLKEASRSCSQN